MWLGWTRHGWVGQRNLAPRTSCAPLLQLTGTLERPWIRQGPCPKPKSMAQDAGGPPPERPHQRPAQPGQTDGACGLRRYGWTRMPEPGLGCPRPHGRGGACPSVIFRPIGAFSLCSRQHELLTTAILDLLDNASRYSPGPVLAGADYSDPHAARARAGQAASPGCSSYEACAPGALGP
jgi:hypothetical protein